jgi:signal transduction histidine kinase/DNA-binding response OmpR family regulator
LRLLLPTGGLLSESAWTRRHRAILAILWTHVPILVIFGIANDMGAHSFIEPAFVAAAAGFASLPFAGRRFRAGVATLGLVTSSALLVHFSGGMIEFHFHFFVVVALVTLYQDWTPFLLAIAYVLFHHGIFGGFYPHNVFNHPEALAHPWKWAAVHALFIAGESAALLAAWRYAEIGQKETLRSLHRLSQAQDVARIATWTWDPATDALHIVDEFDHLAWRASKVDPPSTLNEWLARLEPSGKEAMRNALQRAAAIDERVCFETQRSVADGSLRFFSHVAEAAKDPVSLDICVLGTSRDVTEEKKLHGQLLQSQKMEAVGQLAGGIAHDFNNLLAVVINYARFLIDDLGEDDPRRDDALEVLKAGERGATLTRQLLAFSRKEVIRPEVVDLNEIVAGVERMLSRTLKESIELVTKTTPDLAAVKVDLGQIEQVLLNLAVNSRDAMPQGGKLSIESYSQVVDQDMASQHLGLKPGEYVCLAVSDTGIGMSREVQARIFEPFYTTKPKEKGTGLGLATVYGIMKQNNGYISVYSEVGVGTTFRLYLPPAEKGSVPRPRTKIDVRHSAGAGEKILVVEDEQGVLDLVDRILTKNGYVVLAAASGAEALELTDREQGIALLLTDVILPNMSGKELATKSGLPTIFMSGYTDEIISQQGILEEGQRLIQKPFDPETLLLRVREALGSGPAPEQGLHVMVIEDDPALKDLLRVMLEMNDFVSEVDEATSTDEALALCRQKAPDLVVTDSIGSGPGKRSPGEAIRTEFPGVRIISFSGVQEDRPWADVQITKAVEGLESVADAVRQAAHAVSSTNNLE